MQFGRLWSLWCQSLVPKVPPQMIKRDRFVAGLKPTFRLKVELKVFESFEDAVRVAREKEWKVKKLKQLGMQEEFPKMGSSPEMMKAYAERKGEPTSIQDKSLKDDLHEAMELMKSLRWR